MKQKRNYTLTEQEENKIVNQIYNKKILLIKKLLETCHLTVMDLCVHLNIDTSTSTVGSNRIPVSSVPSNTHKSVSSLDNI